MAIHIRLAAASIQRHASQLAAEEEQRHAAKNNKFSSEFSRE
ncbi:MAG: hypothetical protein M5U34_36775 [Chloroflexi bacterium]|nr:hypothetical protein [Chloroflexota bacterium]